MLPLLLWAVFQIGAIELYAAMQRFPSWQDAHYLFDPVFIKNSTAGLNLTAPYKTATMLATVILFMALPSRRPAWRSAGLGLSITLILFATHGALSPKFADTAIAARFNPLHWLINDAVAVLLRPAAPALTESDLPAGVRQLDLNGTPLTAKGQAKNVLIVVLEGITGLYHPEIRQAMQVTDNAMVMEGLVENTRHAMLIPDFVTHSVQTIRGLYAILCGDFSKLSMKTPKALELPPGSEQAQNALPAQLAAHGWSTHFLQGAGLTFMSKDRIMPKIGFQHVHGQEWFNEQDPYPFEWGVSDPTFFKGARRYIADLQAKGDPWMLTLLTVGTHHPYAPASEAVSRRYPNRVQAAVAMLDEAVADFLKGIREDGVLENTLIIITSDESHGAPFAEWMCSWGLGIVMAPEQKKLPRLKQGTFGLVDISASVLDYFGLPQPATIIGRSFFRDYDKPREMVAYTAGKLRWHTTDNLRYECGWNSDTCLVTEADSLLGYPAIPLRPDTNNMAPLLFSRAAFLDNKLINKTGPREMRFANGEIRRLPTKVINEWSENLIGAQYLDFPKNSKIHVSMRIRAIEADEHGILLQLNLRQYEHLVGDISYPPFPLLHKGEVTEIAFDFENPKQREAFSFHLFGAGNNAAVQIEEFNIIVDSQGS
ncbi:MAG: LTA synthase family protein [Thermodesulfobacteriota bacterium]